MENNVKLLVGLCAHRECSLETTGSLVKLAKKAPFQFVFSKGVYIGKAREEVVLASKTLESTHLLFVDTDIIFEPEDVGELFKTLSENPEMGAVSGNYIKWDGTKNTPCMWEGQTIEQNTHRARSLTIKKKTVPVDGFGAGFLLIDCGVFKNNEGPWFINEEFAGEDYFFCKRLKEIGYSPSVNFDVKVGHVGPSIWKP